MFRLARFTELSRLARSTSSLGPKLGDPFPNDPTRPWIVACLSALGVAGGMYGWSHSAICEQNDSKTEQLPTYSRDEVKRHKTLQDRVWVTRGNYVYDITDFVQMHPGGASKIMLAAGGSVDPFWKLYQQHQTPEIRDILEEYKIGELDQSGAEVQAVELSDPYSSDPHRHPALLARSERPFNAETPGSILSANMVTPTDVFYVRNHLPVPEVDSKSWTLVVEGEGLKTMQFTLQDLKSTFKAHTVTATVQCAGNRRNEMKAVKPVRGLDWDTGAIGTAVWRGVRLRDVMEHAGLGDDTPGLNHVHFVGLDADPSSGDHYAASIPISKVLNPESDVLLAYEMNGEALTRDHGAPLRVVVPGVAGARSVKWLSKVVASPVESSSHWQQRDYKAFSPGVDWDNVDWDSAPAIQDMPITSAICEPMPGEVVDSAGGELPVRGYAWSGGGHSIVRVDVSIDGGKTWTPAKLQKPEQPPHRTWAWTLWEVSVPLPPNASERMEVIARAVDNSYNTQPDSVSAIWNLRGVVNNAWHRVPVTVK